MGGVEVDAVRRVRISGEVVEVVVLRVGIAPAGGEHARIARIGRLHPDDVRRTNALVGAAEAEVPPILGAKTAEVHDRMPVLRVRLVEKRKSLRLALKGRVVHVLVVPLRDASLVVHFHEHHLVGVRRIEMQRRTCGRRRDLVARVGRPDGSDRALAHDYSVGRRTRVSERLDVESARTGLDKPSAGADRELADAGERALPDVYLRVLAADLEPLDVGAAARRVAVGGGMAAEPLHGQAVGDVADLAVRQGTVEEERLHHAEAAASRGGRGVVERRSHAVDGPAVHWRHLRDDAVAAVVYAVRRIMADAVDVGRPVRLRH